MEANNCPRCRTTYAHGAKFCQECGYNLEHELAGHQENYEYQENYNSSANNSNGGLSSISLTKESYTEEEEVETPQNEIDWVALKAPFGDRFLAFVLDKLITLLIGIPSLVFFYLGFDKLIHTYHSNEHYPFFFLAVVFLLAPLFYSLLKDGMGIGQSIGKKKCGLMVIDVYTQRPCSVGQSFRRNIVFIVLNILPGVGPFVELLLIIITENGQRLGDEGANTQVVKAESFKFEKEKREEQKSKAVISKEYGVLSSEDDMTYQTPENSDKLIFIFVGTALLIGLIHGGLRLAEVDPREGIGNILNIGAIILQNVSLLLLSFGIRRKPFRTIGIGVSLIIIIYNFYNISKYMI
ncbi:RDD family protein [Flammeovirga aprica]|uniref:RDD domain-containing protein n=1 Tax=Flammeovirga aprica JL-4 TaxID=694437 RepID=A0A7X9XC94_9BACT|nr:RDD family protein [Flammeovirga aprica]NME71399.1 hypothetical protein [Flammeovirga aprica JL-4]